MGQMTRQTPQSQLPLERPNDIWTKIVVVDTHGHHWWWLGSRTLVGRQSTQGPCRGRCALDWAGEWTRRRTLSPSSVKEMDTWWTEKEWLGCEAVSKSLNYYSHHHMQYLLMAALHYLDLFDYYFSQVWILSGRLAFIHLPSLYRIFKNQYEPDRVFHPSIPSRNINYTVSYGCCIDSKVIYYIDGLMKSMPSARKGEIWCLPKKGKIINTSLEGLTPRLTWRSRAMEMKRTPERKPLYWKWIWSTKKSPPLLNNTTNIGSTGLCCFLHDLATSLLHLVERKWCQGHNMQ